MSLNKNSTDEDILKYLKNESCAFKNFSEKEMDDWYCLNSDNPKFNYILLAKECEVTQLIINEYLLIIELKMNKICVNVCLERNDYCGLDLVGLDIFLKFKYKENLIRKKYFGFWYQLDCQQELFELIRYIFRISNLKSFH